VISVDAKKKELIGDFKQNGREWRPKGMPVKVRTHDFTDPDLGKAIPYGVYDLTNNDGWVSVGITHDTAEFAVETIRRWWEAMGHPSFPKATELLITADSGGSNGHRSRLWKVSLQGLADQIGLKINVCHFPPGTSKWNKIEHRMLCHITQNWRGQPLISRSVVVNLIGNTRTRTGLSIKAKLDKNKYVTGIKVTDEELANINRNRSRGG
jgi:Rhodopirellula transposase.